MVMYQRIITGIFLGICTITDIKKQYVCKQAVLAYFLLVFIGRGVVIAELLAKGGGIQAGLQCMELFTDLLPGGVCFLISWMSREGLGYGDSVLITLCGLSLGFRPCLWITFTAFFWSGVWAAILLLRRRDRRKEFPFVPFLLLGYVIQGFGG